jgi:hypothetical protein
VAEKDLAMLRVGLFLAVCDADLMLHSMIFIQSNALALLI